MLLNVKVLYWLPSFICMGCQVTSVCPPHTSNTPNPLFWGQPRGTFVEEESMSRWSLGFDYVKGERAL